MKNKTKRFFTIIGVGIFITSFLAMIYYGYQSFVIHLEPVTSKEYAYHFVLIAEEKENEYWRLVEKGARRAAEEHNIYLEFAAPEKADNEEMLKLFDRFISSKVDGIMIQGVQGERFRELVHKAVERELPVITVDTDVQNTIRKAYIGTDNYLAGKLLGEALIKNTEGVQHVGVILGRFDAINQQERLNGLEDAIANAPRISIETVKESNITMVGATQAAYSILKENSKINAMVGLSALDGIGIAEGIKEVVPYKDIYVAAFDMLPKTLELIKSGDIDITIAQYPEEMGYQAVEIMIKLQSGDLLETRFFTDTKIISKKDLLLNGEFKP